MSATVILCDGCGVCVWLVCNVYEHSAVDTTKTWSQRVELLFVFHTKLCLLVLSRTHSLESKNSFALSTFKEALHLCHCHEKWCASHVGVNRCVKGGQWQFEGERDGERGREFLVGTWEAWRCRCRLCLFLVFPLCLLAAHLKWLLALCWR